MARYALLIATGRYTDQSFRRLRSPAQDVKRLAEILRDPAIGCFDDVRVCVDQPEHELRVAVEDVLSGRLRDDLVLLYVSCHGVLDRRGRLYFATTNTRLDRLAATALANTFIDEQLSHSMAGGRVLILDCCFSGSFARGLAAKSSVGSPLAGRIGRGYFVLTATDAFEYAFEGESPRGVKPLLSVCTEAIIAGLESGLADRDGDGWVSAYDLYDYVYDVMKQTATQTPTYFASNVEGKLLLARVPQAQSSTAHEATIPPVRSAGVMTSAVRRLSLRARWRVAVVAILLLAAIVFGATLLASPSPIESYRRAISGEPVLNDSLRDNTAGNHWYEARGDFGECKFSEGSYHALPKIDGGPWHVCCEADADFENLAIQVEMTIDRGDEGGIKFRGNGNPGYFFHITKEGRYRLFRTVPGTDSNIDLKRSYSPNPAIKVGANQSNMLAVLAQGPTIHIYANGQHLDTVRDATFPAGRIGLCARDFSGGTDVKFNNIKIWRP